MLFSPLCMHMGIECNIIQLEIFPDESMNSAI